MANKNIVLPSMALRAVHYLFAVICFFLIFILAVTLTPNHIDVTIVLCMIIGVLLMAFMLHINKLLIEIQNLLLALNEKSDTASTPADG